MRILSRSRYVFPVIRSQRGPKGAPRRRKGGNSEHDRGYKLLFSHPRFVEELLRGFLPGPWLDRLDFSTLQKVSGSVITDDLRERHDDVIWMLRWNDGGEERWIYLLLELQSAPDGFMTVRMLGGATMLDETFMEWGQKVRREERRAGRREGRREGQVEGMQKLVLNTLRQRFGPVPQAVRQRIREISSSAELTKLNRRILASNSLRETGLL